MLRKEYLNQTFNFMPELRTGYDKAAKNQYYEKAQMIVMNLQVLLSSIVTHLKTVTRKKSLSWTHKKL